MKKTDAEPAGDNLLPDAVARVRTTGSGADWKPDGRPGRRRSRPPDRPARQPGPGRGQYRPRPHGRIGRDPVLGFAIPRPAEPRAARSSWRGGRRWAAATARSGSPLCGSAPATRSPCPSAASRRTGSRMSIGFERRGAGAGALGIVDLWLKPASQDPGRAGLRKVAASGRQCCLSVRGKAATLAPNLSRSLSVST